MYKTKKIICIVTLLMLAFSTVACTKDNDVQGPDQASGNNVEHTFTVAMDAAEDTIAYLYADRFKAILEERLNGKVLVQLYPNAQLGGDLEIAESCQAGEIDFVVQNTAPQVSIISKLGIFDLPKLFPDVKTARNVLNGSLFDTLDAIYEEHDFKLLGFTDQGYRVMSSNKKVEKIDDFNGIKIRTMQNPNHIEYWKSLGANPTPMAFSEVYLGLQQGIIDAQENPYEEIVASKFYEQQKYVINTNHIYHNIVLVGSLKNFNKLTNEYQQAIEEAATEASKWACQQADLREQDRVKIMEDYGVEIINLSSEVHKQMQGKADIVYNTIRSKVGDDLVDQVLKAINEELNK